MTCEKLEARLPNYDFFEVMSVPDLELYVMEEILPPYLSVCFKCTEDFKTPGVYRPIFLDLTQDHTFIASGFLSNAAKKRISTGELLEIFPSWGEAERAYSSEYVDVTLQNRTGTIDFKISAQIIRTENEQFIRFEKMKLILGKDFAFKFMRSFSGDWGDNERGQLYFTNIHNSLYKTSFEEKRLW